MALLLFGLTVFVSISVLMWAILYIGEAVRNDMEDKFSREANMTMTDMFMFVDGEKLARYYTIAIIALPIMMLVLSRSFQVAIVTLALTVVLPRWFYGQMMKARQTKINSQLPEAFMSPSSNLQAGMSLNGALEALTEDQPAPISQEFSLMTRKIMLGVSFDDAIKEMEERLPLPDLHVALSAIRISREVGGNLVEVMENLADTLRRKATMEGKIISLTSQGKAQGYVMTGLPILLGVVLNTLEPEAMSKLYSTPYGYATLAVIIVMLGMGFSVIRKLTTIDV